MIGEQALTNLLLHLSLIENIGPAAIIRLMAVLRVPVPAMTEQSSASLSPNLLYCLSAKELQSLAGLPEKLAYTLHAGLANKKLLEQELKLIEEYNISVTTVLDEGYPFLLKNTHLPPIVLYAKGAAKLNSDFHLAVVGSRKADSYGQKAIDMLIPALVSHGWSIVSGGALGIDSMAHQAALDAKGITIAVLGSGLLKPYPARNKQLFKRIIDSGGALISSFPLTMEAQPGFFPARNRIIAGVSRGSVVVQAAEQSGALITAQYGLDEGRELFAVPGPFDNPLSAGCHKLISEGATLVTSPADILRTFGQEIRGMQMELAFKAENATPEQKIIQLCAQPISFEELLVQSGIERGILQDLLCELNVNGTLMQNRVGLWSRM